MTTRRDFISKAVVGSLLASTPFARARALAVPSPPTSLVIGDQVAPAGSFYDDPYSSYATWYVNGTSGTNTANPGRDRRPAGFVYQNYENALQDVFYAGNPGMRRIIVQAGVYSPMSSSIGGYFPAGGPDAAHPCVIQGDPTAGSPPVIDGGFTSSPAFCIGNKGGYGTSQINLGNIVIRKLEIRNFACDSIYFYWGSATNVTIEYCSIHTNRYPPSTPSSGGAIAVTTANCVDGLTIRYCKFFDFLTSGGGYNVNCVPFETYGSNNVTISNCLFSGAYMAIRLKLLDGVGTADNYTIRNNIFANCYNAIVQGTNGNSFLANNNWVITGNLFYGPPLNVGAGSTAAAAWSNQGFVSPGTPQGANVLWANNTIAEDMTAGVGWIGATGIIVRDNVSLANGRHFYTTDGSNGFQSLDMFSMVDFNAYGGGSTWNLGWGQLAYAFKSQYSSFAQWQKAELSSLAAPFNPDVHGLWLPSLRPPFNTVASNFANAKTRDYTIAAGSPLLTASSTGGPVGYNSGDAGPGW